jgi:hypothetical protein
MIYRDASNNEPGIVKRKHKPWQAGTQKRQFTPNTLKIVFAKWGARHVI